MAILNMVTSWGWWGSEISLVDVMVVGWWGWGWNSTCFS